MNEQTGSEDADSSVDMKQRDGVQSQSPRLSVVSTSSSSTPAVESVRKARTSLRRTPVFRPHLRRVSTGASTSKLYAAFKSPVRNATHEAVGTSSTTPNDTRSSVAITRTLKAPHSSCRLTASSRPSPYLRTPTRTNTAASRSDRAAGTKETQESIAADIAELREQLKSAESEIAELSEEYSEEELQQYIDHLHEYNEIKDVGQMLLGKLAEVQGTTTAELYQKFGLHLDD